MKDGKKLERIRREEKCFVRIDYFFMICKIKGKISKKTKKNSFCVFVK